MMSDVTAIFLLFQLTIIDIVVVVDIGRRCAHAANAGTDTGADAGARRRHEVGEEAVIDGRRRRRRGHGRCRKPGGRDGESGGRMLGWLMLWLLLRWLTASRKGRMRGDGDAGSESLARQKMFVRQMIETHLSRVPRLTLVLHRWRI